MSEAAAIASSAVPDRRGRPPVPLLPALSLLDRLRATSRLGVVIALLLVPGLVATVAYTYSEKDQISFSSSERGGVRVLRPALAAMATLISTHQLDLTAVDAAVHATPQFGLGKELTALDSAAQGADLTTPTGRMPVVTAFSDLVTEAGNSSNLILDPDLDSFYVMDAQVVQIPRALVAAASAEATLGATGSASLVASRAVLAGGLSAAADALRTDLKTAVANTNATGLATELAPVTALADASTRLAAALTASLGTGGADARALADAAARAAPVTGDALDDLLKARIAARKFALFRVLVVTTVGFLLAFWLAIAVWWRSRNDVTQVVRAVRAVAVRDTGDHPLPSGRDEFGDIGRAVRRAREQLAEQNAALQEAQRQQEIQMKENHAHQRRAEKQARERAQQIIEESISELTAELSEVATEVDAVRSAAGTIHSRVDQAEVALRAVLAQAANADKVTTALSERLQRVAGMTKLIASVAAQTKLLALNATIEAARAGAAGRGFGVVADEVKQLAATTAHSTEEITGTVQALEREADAVSATITAMTAGIDGVDRATGALVGVASEQQTSVASMDQRISAALARVGEMNDLTNLMERRQDERIPLSGPAWFTADGHRYQISARDLSSGGFRGLPEEGAVLPNGLAGRLELPVPGLLPVHAEVLRRDAGNEVVLVFRLPADELDRLRQFLGSAV